MDSARLVDKMRRIYSPKLDSLEAERRNANKGCHICPSCGEYRQAWQCSEEINPFSFTLNDKGILIESDSGLLKKDHVIYNYCVDRYRCLTCGALWESEPFMLIPHSGHEVFPEEIDYDLDEDEMEILEEDLDRVLESFDEIPEMDKKAIRTVILDELRRNMEDDGNGTDK